MSDNPINKYGEEVLGHISALGVVIYILYKFPYLLIYASILSAFLVFGALVNRFDDGDEFTWGGIFWLIVGAILALPAIFIAWEKVSFFFETISRLLAKITNYAWSK